MVPPLPGKALKRQLPFRGDDGIFEEEFIEDRRKGDITVRLCQAYQKVPKSYDH